VFKPQSSGRELHRPEGLIKVERDAESIQEASVRYVSYERCNQAYFIVHALAHTYWASLSQILRSRPINCGDRSRLNISWLTGHEVWPRAIPGDGNNRVRWSA
jgi:hypothetical protein